jgi:hypothetical protein
MAKRKLRARAGPLRWPIGAQNETPLVLWHGLNARVREWQTSLRSLLLEKSLMRFADRSYRFSTNRSQLAAVGAKRLVKISLLEGVGAFGSRRSRLRGARALLPPRGLFQYCMRDLRPDQPHKDRGPRITGPAPWAFSVDGVASLGRGFVWVPTPPLFTRQFQA